MHIAGLIARHARYHPDRTAVVFQDQRLGWREFNRRVNRLAHALRGAGVEKGERVATVLPNCIELLDVSGRAPSSAQWRCRSRRCSPPADFNRCSRMPRRPSWSPAGRPQAPFSK